MASPTFCDEFAANVELYYTFINKMKAENPQLNISEVRFARGTKKVGKNEVPLGSIMSLTLLVMTVSSRNMSIMH
jgi:hypothetical protein